MTKSIFCQKLQKDAPALQRAPYPGPLGERILAEISEEAWTAWLSHQTMLINEYRLSPIDPKSRSFLEQEMQKYFFGEGADRPAGYVDPSEGK